MLEQGPRFQDQAIEVSKAWAPHCSLQIAFHHRSETTGIVVQVIGPGVTNGNGFGLVIFNESILSRPAI